MVFKLFLFTIFFRVFTFCDFSMASESVTHRGILRIRLVNAGGSFSQPFPIQNKEYRVELKWISGVVQVFDGKKMVSVAQRTDGDDLLELNESEKVRIKKNPTLVISKQGLKHLLDSLVDPKKGLVSIRSNDLQDGGLEVPILRIPFYQWDAKRKILNDPFRSQAGAELRGGIILTEVKGKKTAEIPADLEITLSKMKADREALGNYDQAI